MKPAPAAADRGPMAPTVAAVNALLRVELAAVATYDLALTRFENHPFQPDLRTIRHHHESAVGVLRDHVRNMGGEPAEGAAPWGEFGKLVPGTAKPSGPDVLLGTLQRGEEQGVNEYERVLQGDDLPQECRFAIRAELLPHCHEHLDTLSAMMSAAAKKG
jgi:hypothetical protein